VLVLLGARFSDMLSHLPQDRIIHHNSVHPAALPFRLPGLNLDIGLVPNKANEWNKYRSITNWLEYAALEIPTATSYTEPFNDLPIDTGVFVEGNNKDGWIDGLSWLIEDCMGRGRLAGQARSLVEEEYNINKQYPKWVDAYQGLFN